MPVFTDWSTVIAVTLLIAFLTETVVEAIKTQFSVLSEGNIQLVSLVLAILLAFLMQVSLFAEGSVGLKLVGFLIIGLVASRGASYAHNWFDKLPRK
ncbi:hypothetical protein ACK8P5_25780 (plasmid) [Paenibacillus sp. EC2-1]|uniref:hypothetical protein n=1 Tax=Paenibacillus sp. EC2-1 TaxID=3388665 RepID=UPI003BEEBDDC